jgi:hypothetical protein
MKRDSGDSLATAYTRNRPVISLNHRRKEALIDAPEAGLNASRTDR